MYSSSNKYLELEQEKASESKMPNLSPESERDILITQRLEEEIQNYNKIAKPELNYSVKSIDGKNIQVSGQDLINNGGKSSSYSNRETIYFGLVNNGGNFSEKFSSKSKISHN